MPEDTRIITSEHEGTVVAQFQDEDILDEVVIGKLGEQLNGLATAVDCPKIVLDFAHVQHMSSAALGMLITLQKRVRERKGQLRLCNIRPAIYEVFVITKLNEIFQIHTDRGSALGSLR